MIMNTPQIQDFAGKRIHMIGIGGSSMSGLAQMLQHLGYQVTGSDQNDGYLMNDVRQAGAKVTIGHRAENVHGADLVVYTAAIPLTNPERAEAERLHIPSMERAELLGQLMRHYARAIGICGAHGKTTTTSMLSEILVECGLDPSVHIGGKLDAIGGSTRYFCCRSVRIQPLIPAYASDDGGCAEYRRGSLGLLQGYRRD